jgi:hypothetical protein
MENHSRRKFHAQIPEEEAAPHRKPHLTARGFRGVFRFQKAGKSLAAGFAKKSRKGRKEKQNQTASRSLFAIFAGKSVWPERAATLAQV